jgi:hypothetical protein
VVPVGEVAASVVDEGLAPPQPAAPLATPHPEPESVEPPVAAPPETGNRLTYLTFGKSLEEAVAEETPLPDDAAQSLQTVPETAGEPETAAEPAPEPEPPTEAEAGLGTELEPDVELQREGPLEQAEPEVRSEPALVPAVATPDFGSALEPTPATAGGETIAPLIPAAAEQRKPAVGRRRPVRTTALAAAVGGIAVAAALGFVVAPTSTRSSTPSNTLTRSAARGPITVSYPANWAPNTASPTTGMTLANEVAVGPTGRTGGGLVVGTTVTREPSLLPAAFLAALQGGAPTPEVVTLGPRQFYRYLVLRPRNVPPETVYAFPTTTGSVIGVCQLSNTAPDVPSTCEHVLARLRIVGAHVLGLGPSATFGAGLTHVLATLNAATARAGTAFSAAHKSARQAAAAGAFASAYGQAAAAVARLEPGPRASTATGALVSALGSIGKRYAALAHAAAHDDKRGYDAARAAIGSDFSAVTAALAKLKSAGYQTS